MEAPTRAFMETGFGHDFSGVRIHTDARASQMAHSMRARAFTTGNHIVFGAGEYTPHSQQGRRLLAHELAHVVQQGASTPHPHGLRAAAPTLHTSVRAQGALVQRQVGGPINISPACHQTQRRSDPWHEAIQADFLSQVEPLLGRREYAIPGSSAGGAVGYADLVSLGNYGIYEIKSYNDPNIQAGQIQVGRYVAGALQYCSPHAPWHRGTSYPDRVIPFGVDREIVAKQYGQPGLILYYERRRQRQPQPVPVPVPVPAPQPQERREPRGARPVPAPVPVRPTQPRPAPSTRDVIDILIGLGLSLALVAVVIAALADPEPASKLALAGLSVVMVTAILEAFGLQGEASTPPSA